MSASSDGSLMFSIDAKLRYTGFNQSFVAWTKQHFSKEPLFGNQAMFDEISASSLERLKFELNSQPLSLSFDCSSLFNDLQYVDYFLNQVGENCVLTLCFELTDIQQHFYKEHPFFDLSLDLFSITGFDNYFIQLNKAWEDVLGYTIEELKAIPYHEFMHPDDYIKLLDLVESLGDDQKHIQLVNRYKKKSGGYIRLEWKATIDHEKQLSYAVARDITDQWNMEITLANLANSVPGALLQYRVHPDGTDSLPYISEQVELLWEVSKEQALQDTQSLWSPILEEDLPRMQESVAKSAQELSFWDHTWRIVTKSGKLKWLNGRGYPRKLPDGSVLWDTLILDNTRLQEAEIRLRETNVRLGMASEASNIGIWEMSPDGRQLIWNEAMHNIYEVPESEFHNRVEVPLSMIHPEDEEDINLTLEKLLRGEVVNKYRFRIITSSGSTKYLEAASTVLRDENNEIIKLIGVNDDITDFIDKERKLEETIRQKETLFRELHHRIKNNLNIVSSFLYVKSRSTNDSKLQELIKEINGRILSIAKTHDQLLKLEEVNQLYSETYLTDLVHTLCNTYTEHPEHYELKFEIENHKMPVDHLLLLGLIVNEIISNIIKHAYPLEAGGPIDLSFKKVSHLFELRISDEGGGKEANFSSNSKSMGLNLIELLTKQLSGSLIRKVDAGVNYIISFELNEKK